MIPQYTYDNNGNPIGVFIPIDEWYTINEKYSGIEDISPREKKLIDQRLYFIKNYPNQLIPLEEFILELDQDDEV